MATVTVPSDFFRKELFLYANWREAFWRELLQNSIDAGADQVRIVTTLEDGFAQITIADNGCGMTRDIVENVFFCLGRTTKTGPDTIGGFGRARIITCFAQESYEIHTSNLHVSGQGGEFEIETADRHANGTLFQIRTIETDPSALERALRTLVGSSTMKAVITLNGHELAGDHGALGSRAVKLLRDSDGTSWARVIKTNLDGMFIVRVGGLATFTRYTGSSKGLAIEVETGRARQVLIANRDGFVEPYASQIDQLIAQLRTNQRAALQDDGPKVIHYDGGGPILSPADPTATAPIPADSAWLGPVCFEADTVPSPLSHSVARSRLGHDVYIEATDTSTATRRLMRRYDPSNWGDYGGRREELLIAWRTACLIAIRTLIDARKLDDTVWSVGWIFDNDVAALKSERYGVSVLSLRPTTPDGTPAFKVSATSDRRRLLSFALHEACHVVRPDHDEAFARLLTDVVGLCDFGAADRQIRNEVAAHRQLHTKWAQASEAA